MLIERKEHKNENNYVDYIESIYDSQNILKSIYFMQSKRLYIYFKSGIAYSYGNIDNELYDEFEKNESQGKFFAKKIKNNNKYPYRKEFSLLSNELNELLQIVNNKNKYVQHNDDNRFDEPLNNKNDE